MSGESCYWWRQHTNKGNTQTKATHKQRQHTNKGNTQTKATHKQRQHTNKGNTQTQRYTLHNRDDDCDFEVRVKVWNMVLLDRHRHHFISPTAQFSEVTVKEAMKNAPKAMEDRMKTQNVFFARVLPPFQI